MQSNRRHGGRTHRRSRFARGAGPPRRRPLRLPVGASDQPRRGRVMTGAARILVPVEASPPPAAQRPERLMVSLSGMRGGSLAGREVLAAALEILETPASPVHMAFLWIICALVTVNLTWAYFGRIDIIASAQGKFQPTGRVKVIEPLDTGRVAAIRATNGSAVAEGDVLVELDRSAAEADLAAAKDAFASARAETLRR